MEQEFEMVAKTFQGLEDVLAEELRGLGAKNVEPGRRMVSFEGDKEMLYKANLCCRTALRILKPIYKFIARDTDELYERVKEIEWDEIMTPDRTFAIDVTAYSDEFTHSQYATYRIKDAIVDYFKDKYDDKRRPRVCLQGADVQLNAHISGDRVTISLDSSGESLHKRGYRVAQTEAPINEVLAAGIILKSGWRGDCPLVDPMCGSGTFLIEAALIGANINPGVFRSGYAFEQWPDFDPELFERLYNDDSQEREFHHKIYGADVLPTAVQIARENIKSAGVGRYIELELKDLAEWDEAPQGGVLVTNPPYGERISVNDMDGLYALLGQKLKRVFKGYHAWIIGYRDEYFHKIGLTPSVKVPMYNGSLECELREYVIFEGDYRSFRAAGDRIKSEEDIERQSREKRPMRRKSDEEWRREARDRGFGGRDSRRGDRPAGRREDKRDFKKRFDADREKFATRADRQAERRKRFEATGDSDRPKWRRDDKPGFKPGFRRDDKPGFRRDRDDFRRDDRRPGRFSATERKSDPFASQFSEPIPENPFAKRRNAHALKSITGKLPSLSPRGKWRKPDDDSSANNDK